MRAVPVSILIGGRQQYKMPAFDAFDFAFRDADSEVSEIISRVDLGTRRFSSCSRAEAGS